MDYAKAMKSMVFMTGPHREVLHLTYIEGLSCKEIAGKLHLSLSTVKGRLRRGLDCLRQEMTLPNGPVLQHAINDSDSAGRIEHSGRRHKGSVVGLRVDWIGREKPGRLIA